IPSVSAGTAPLWEHCRRSLEHAAKLGPHGVPLIGSGDWNDGMNRVGVEGRGESVWLGWFLCMTLESFARVIARRDPAVAIAWRERAAAIAESIEQSCWDGEWYLRGF